MIPLNLSAQVSSRLASILGCKLTTLPITYLGVPIHWTHLITEHWDALVDKVETKLQGWKGKLLSLGGRVTLLNSVISTIPLYWLSVYRLPNKVRQRIDKLRRRFLWLVEIV